MPLFTGVSIFAYHDPRKWRLSAQVAVRSSRTLPFAPYGAMPSAGITWHAIASAIPAAGDTRQASGSIIGYPIVLPQYPCAMRNSHPLAVVEGRLQFI